MGIFATIEKYLMLILAAVHAANTIIGATNADKREVVVKTVAADEADAGTIKTIGAIVDVVATVVNKLADKTVAK